MGGSALVNNTLQVRETGAVVKLHKTKTLGIAPGAYPAADSQRSLGLGGSQRIDNERALHGDSFLITDGTKTALFA